MLRHIFRGHKSAWFPLLTARRFAEFDTSLTLVGDYSWFSCDVIIFQNRKKCLSF